MAKRFIITILSITTFFFACTGYNKKEQETFEFYYYPNKNVYYDLEKKKFFYSLDGAKTWYSLINFSGKEPSNLGEKVMINSPDSSIFKDNENHRRLYAGRLFGINKTDSSSLLGGPEVSERKVIAKPKTDIAGEETATEVEIKAKKGIRKFFDKIFGKHKKKTNANL